MSVLYESNLGFFISHEKFFENVYSNVIDNENEYSFRLHKNLFKIDSTYHVPTKSSKQKHNLKRKRENGKFDDEISKEVKHVKDSYAAFRKELLSKGLLCEETIVPNKNVEALEAAENIYNISGESDNTNSVGQNDINAVCTIVNDSKYLFPVRCKFYCKDVKNIGVDLYDEKYDLILLDPPWWNKYIRRKRCKTNNAYDMIYNDDLKDIPIEKLIKNNGIVVVWCTNSNQHLETLTRDIFNKWNIKFWGKWYWLKVTVSGVPICEFSEPPNKQPFEQIIFGSRRKLDDSTQGKIIVSVPSALHSHKPPLIELLRRCLPDEPKCLEIFARYLLPDWTSYGLESFRFQHESLYENI